MQKLNFIFDGDFLDVYLEPSKSPMYSYFKIKKSDYEKLKTFVFLPREYFLPNFYLYDKTALQKYNDEHAVQFLQYWKDAKLSLQQEINNNNYKVKIIEHKNEPYLAAACFYILPWNCCSNMDEITLGRFEASTFGIEVAENWLRNKFISDYKLGIPEKLLKSLPHQKRYIESRNICL